MKEKKQRPGGQAKSPAENVIREIVRMMKAERILELKYNGIEVTLSRDALPPILIAPEAKDERTQEQIERDQQAQDENVLFYSAGE